MVDPALLYVGAVVVLFFFWIYGIVSFGRDAKRYLVPAYRRWRRDDADGDEPADQPGGRDPRDAPGSDRSVE